MSSHVSYRNNHPRAKQDSASRDEMKTVNVRSQKRPAGESWRAFPAEWDRKLRDYSSVQSVSQPVGQRSLFRPRSDLPLATA